MTYDPESNPGLTKQEPQRLSTKLSPRVGNFPHTHDVVWWGDEGCWLAYQKLPLSVEVSLCVTAATWMVWRYVFRFVRLVDRPVS